MINFKKTFEVVAVLLIISVLSIEIVAQNSTNSPYTRFGYGKLTDAGFGRANAMGGIGFGFRNKTTINPANPAAYSCIDSTSFLFEFGFSGLVSSYSTNSTRTSKLAGNIDYLALQFPVAKWLGVSAGIIPYSFTGYNFSTIDSTMMPDPIDTTYIHKNQLFSGTGGISQLYLGLSFDLFERLSVGINGYYMFGSVNNYRYLNVSSSDNRMTYSTYSHTELRVRSLNTRIGLQYHQPLCNQKDELTVGAIYEFQHKLGSEYSTQIVGLDTTTQTGTNAFELPNVYGLGVTYHKNNRLLFGADFQYQQFAKAKFQNFTDTLNNRMKIAAGLEYIHKPNGNKYIDRVRWRVGANYTNSYINVNGRSTNDFAITAGVGFPFRTIKSVLNVNFEYGQFGTTSFDMIKENYFRIGVNFTLNENWFYKPKIQ
ncbi:MAG: hypothetical protein LBT04_03995 [Prevotellaceae bacterium]|jgi:hypothetical protein|nr:hypothetical protein [Prevotellaceae bacterium]